MRRIERLINLIAALLEARRPLTAQDIRDTISGYDQLNHDAFRRAFERDKDALRSMGIPLDTVPADKMLDGRADGYIIAKSRYYLPELDLKPDELAALRIAAQAILGGATDAESGLMKLSVDSGGDPAPGPRVVWGADLAAEQPSLGAFYSALLDHKPVEFGYQTAGAAAASRRRVYPYGLVHRRGHWYVVGQDIDKDDVRAFKVARVSGAITRMDGSYSIPSSFDAAAHVGGEAWAIGPEASDATLVRFDASMRWWVEQNMRGLPTSPGAEGALDVEVPVANVDALISWIIGFGSEVEILAPESARRRLIEHLAPYLEQHLEQPA
ncbi:MAG: WYL domain-containing protein [Actinobacteria bacterium]|nr:WYL domain-containing protein [Actinomycetota bacterium]